MYFVFLSLRVPHSGFTILSIDTLIDFLEVSSSSKGIEIGKENVKQAFEGKLSLNNMSEGVREQLVQALEQSYWEKRFKELPGMSEHEISEHYDVVHDVVTRAVNDYIDKQLQQA